MKIYPYTIQVNRDSAKDWSGSAAPVKIVFEDTILLAVKVFDFDFATNAYKKKDFTLDGGTPGALRATIRRFRDSTSELYAYQYSYNQGKLSGFGDLTIGHVEWEVDLSNPQIKTDLDNNNGVLDCYLEFSYLDGDDYSSTLAQIPIKIVDQIDPT